MAEWEEDEAEGMRLAVGIREVREGWDFCGLGASVVGAGGRVRWGVVEKRGAGRPFRGICVVDVGSGRHRWRYWERLVEVWMTSAITL